MTLVGTDRPGAGAVIVGVDISARFGGGGKVYVKVGSTAGGVVSIGGKVLVGFSGVLVGDLGVSEGGVVMIITRCVGVQLGRITAVGGS